MKITLKDFDLDEVFFTADQHFGHANIIKYANRPHRDVTEMDAALAANWNSKVPHRGLVFHLGDFTLLDASAAVQYFAPLNGTIMVLSNPWHHDARWLPYYQANPSEKVRIVTPMVVLEVPQLGKTVAGKTYPQAITLCHYPVAEWDRKHHGGWHLHGHSHGKFQGYASDEKAIDVGVDAQGYMPVSLAEIVEQMAARV